jgi:hypothetical protein
MTALLEQPLPPELAGSGQGGLTRYRRYPVFSAVWVRGRLLVVGGACGSRAAVDPAAAAECARAPPGPGELCCSWQCTCSCPRWVAGASRGRWAAGCAFAPGRSHAAHASAAPWSSFCVARRALLAFDEWACEPIKQWIAERNGQVGESGQRKRLVMRIGSTLFTLWLGGGAALWGWRRWHVNVNCRVHRPRDQAGARGRAVRP